MAGYIQKRGNGAYRLIITFGKDDTGNLIRYSKTVHVQTKKEADKLMALFFAEIESAKKQPVPVNEPDKLTFEQFAKQFIEYCNGRLAQKTRYRYEEFLTSRINPAIGHIPLTDITPMHLRDFYAKLQQEPNKCAGREGFISAQTILHHHRLIHNILQTAFMWDLIVSNPAAKVKPPKVPPANITVYTAADVALK